LIDIFRKKQIYKNIPELKNTTKPTLKTVEACQVGLFFPGPSKTLCWPFKTLSWLGSTVAGKEMAWPHGRHMACLLRSGWGSAMEKKRLHQQPCLPIGR